MDSGILPKKENTVEETGRWINSRPAGIPFPVRSATGLLKIVNIMSLTKKVTDQQGDNVMKKIFYITATCFALLSPLTVWGGCVEGDCVNGQGTYAWDDGTTYTGSIKNKAPEGSGKMLYGDGGEYTGEMKSGGRHGKGKMSFADGRKYEGEWSADLMNGQGVMTWTDGRKYDGQWLDGLQHGKGTLTAADGTSKSGNWEDGDFIE